MDVEAEMIKEEQFEESTVCVKTESADEDISTYVEYQNNKILGKIIKEESHDEEISETDIHTKEEEIVPEVKEESSSDEMHEGSLYKIKSEELMLKSEREHDDCETGFATDLEESNGDQDEMWEKDINTKEEKVVFETKEESEDSLPEIKTEELMLKSESEDDSSKTGYPGHCSMESKIVPYTNQEKILLASLVDKYKVVENKKTDATNVQQKKLSWQKIAVEYNAQADFISGPRTDTQLKKLWNNLKQRKRKANTEVHYARLQTGGGPPPKEEDDPVMEAVDISAPYADVEVECPWDCTEEYKRSRKISYSEDHKTVSNSESLPCTTETASPSSAMFPQVTTDSSVPINTSTPSVTRLTNSKRGVALLATESNLRVRKLQEAIVQQQELHRVRMDVENELLEKTRAEKNKAKYEEELAHLKLLTFKKEVAQKPT